MEAKAGLPAGGPHAPAEAPGPGVRLPELARFAWRRPVGERGLLVRERLSAAFTLTYCIPFLVAAAVLIALEPLLFPAALGCLVHAWVIPELFAYRGARVVFPAERLGHPGPERTAQGLLGDLLDHRERELQRRTGLALARGRLGVWLVGESGALLLRPGGRRVHAFCARVTEDDLPPSDRIAHLLLALREDEIGFATLANHAFAGATWRIRRRLRPAQREALAAAREISCKRDNSARGILASGP